MSENEPLGRKAEPHISQIDAATPFRLSRWGILFATCVGVFVGIGFFTFGYGKGASYLSNDPQTCVNCHVMQGHMDSWQQSSHHAVAVCNDCHLPHYFVGSSD